MMRQHFMLSSTIACLLSLNMLAGCSDKSETSMENQPAADVTLSPAADNPVQTNQQANAASTAAANLPEDAPEIGTPIMDLIKGSAKNAANPDDVNKIMWEDLIPVGYEPSAIMMKYQDIIDNIPEGSQEERELFDEIMAEFNKAPANDQLNGKKVKIPGFIAPLDEYSGMVGEFLLVTLFRQLHSRPPPTYQPNCDG